jgi:hypothetical protein
MRLGGNLVGEIRPIDLRNGTGDGLIDARPSTPRRLPKTRPSLREFATGRFSVEDFCEPRENLPNGGSLKV